MNTAYSKLEREAERVGLEVNVDKTKYLLSSSKGSTRPRTAVDGKEFEIVNELVYLGTSVNTNNDISVEVQRRITLANKCYFGLNRQWRSKVLSRRTKVVLYKTLIIPVLLYGAEA